MKILIVVPRYNATLKKDYNYKFPTGLSYISSSLKRAKYSVNCLNLNHFDGKASLLLDNELKKNKYDVVCTGGNTLMYGMIKLIADTVSQHVPKPILIIGGPIITSEPELMLKSIKPTFGVISEGEVTIIELLKALKEKEDLSKVNGIIYQNKTGEIIITKPREPIKDVDSIPFPDYKGLGFSDYLNNSLGGINIQDHPRTYSLLGSRGCPFNCSFCWHDLKYRARSMDEILKELEANVKAHRINSVILLDDCFSASPKRVHDFCEGIKKISREFGWQINWICSLMVTSVNKELLKKMHESGCIGIAYGFESYNPIILKSMRKNITTQQIDTALKLTIERKIGVIAGFILGDIAETRETAKETIDYWEKNSRGQIMLGFIKPYPGSDVYKYCINQGIIKDKLSYIQNEMVSKKVVKMTKNFTEKEFKDLVENVTTLFGKSYYFGKIISIKKNKLKSNAHSIKIICPFCGKISDYKNCLIPNKLLFRSNGQCKNCRMAFLVVSPLQRLIYLNYTLFRKLFSYYLILKNRIIIRRN